MSRAPRDIRASQRRRMIAAVHAAAAKAGLDEETRRALQERITGRRSCADMTIHQLAQVLDEINGRKAKALSADRVPLVAKLAAIAQALGLPWPDYVMGISRQMFGRRAPARLEWHTPDQLRRLVAAMAIHQRRMEGRDEQNHR